MKIPIIPTLLLLASAACGATEPDRPTIRVEGTVTKRATGEPVPEVTVKFTRMKSDIWGNPISYATIASSTTDAAGRYSLSASVAPCYGSFSDISLGFYASPGHYNPFFSTSPKCTEDLQVINHAMDASPLTINGTLEAEGMQIH